MKSGICGIYKITNNFNGYSYIGQSVDIKRRWYEHSKISTHKNEMYCFQNALKKYGVENFTFEILEECPREQLNEREKFYIKQYRTFIGWKDCKGYNSTTGGDTDNNFNTRKIVQYDKHGNYIATFQNINEAVQATGIGRSFIYSCCNKNCRSAKGYQFIYEGDIPPKNYFGYTLLQLDKRTEEIINTFYSISEAEKYTGISITNICACLRGAYKSAGGYKWKKVLDEQKELKRR